MFGYITPHRCELKMREWAQYQGFYCGLCKTLRHEYGQIPRLVLDYDCTFLALLLQGVQGEAAPMRHSRCGYKPFKAKAPVAQYSEALQYAADCNVLLYYHKLRDDWQDDRRIDAWTASLALRRAFFKASMRQPQAANAIQEGLAALARIERACEPQIDPPADAFAHILSGIAAGFAPLKERDKQILSWLGYHMGRFIYLIDAWDDREKDKKSGSYNPFVISNADQERASFLLYASLLEMEKAYDLLDIHANEGLLHNILHQGCRFKAAQLLKGVGNESV